MRFSACVSYSNALSSTCIIFTQTHARVRNKSRMTSLYELYGETLSSFGVWGLKYLDFGAAPEFRFGRTASISAAIAPAKHNLHKSNTGPHVTLGWRRWNIIFFIYYLAHSAFIVYRAVEYMIRTTTDDIFLFTSLTWICVVSLGGVSYYIFLMKARDIEEMLQSWKSLERRLLTQFPNSFPHLWEIIPKERRFLQRVQITAVLIKSAAIGLVVYHIVGIPRAPVYLYSLVPTSVEITWLFYFSVFLQSFYMIVFHQVRSQMDGLRGCFSRSMQMYLLLVEGAIDSNENLRKGQSVRNVSQALEFYCGMEHLMNKFNRIFCWGLLTDEGLAVMYITMSIMLCFRPQLDQPDGFTPMYFAAAFMAISLAGAVIYTHAMTNKLADNFVNKMRQRVSHLPQFDAAIWHQVDALLPFGFQCGSLYMIRTRTCMTYFSVITTYIVVGLEINGN